MPIHIYSIYNQWPYLQYLHFNGLEREGRDIQSYYTAVAWQSEIFYWAIYFFYDLPSPLDYLI